MLSILIPVYNTIVVELAGALQQQCLALQVPFELIVLDDGSEAAVRSLNAALQDLEGVQYLELEQNIGRSRIRNRLASMAQYPYLLFLDGDSQVVHPEYIARYLRHLTPGAVIYGGRTYSDRPPEDRACRLHWHYGRQREALSADRRRQFPYRTFMTNNFVVPRAVSSKLRFDESIQGYGYEDTVYALELQEAGIPILHIDNPLQHIGLEKQTVFLRKAEEALDNLQELLQRYPRIDTRLLRIVRKLHHLRLTTPVRWSTRLWLSPLRRFLLARSQPPLRLLDLYKLGYFLHR